MCAPCARTTRSPLHDRLSGGRPTAGTRGSAHPGVGRTMKPLVIMFTLGLVIAVGALIAESLTFGGAWLLHRRGLYDDELRWLEGLQPVMRWERGVTRLIARREHERIERAMADDRIDRAVHLFRDARTRARSSGLAIDEGLTELGIEVYRRASDRMARHGRLSEAADWCDSTLVLAIRAPLPEHRYAALAGFMEGLDLRVRDGKPCAALARVQWAKRGLGGIVPGLAANVEEDLTMQCIRQRREAAQR
jgi:hypothetical protein